jgi:RNA polymerase sigma factor (sigma-70 family)
MDENLSLSAVMAEGSGGIAEAFAREGTRLRAFIRKRVRDVADVEDILQDVFYEFVEAERAMRPVERVAAWLYRVARNRITDRFRASRRTQPLESATGEQSIDEESDLSVLDLLPAGDAPEAAYARDVLLEELDAALDELPAEQREAFVAHELEGLSFKDLAARTGVSVNTLLSRKRYAVLHLRRRLHTIYEEFTEL